MASIDYDCLIQQINDSLVGFIRTNNWSMELTPVHDTLEYVTLDTDQTRYRPWNSNVGHVEFVFNAPMTYNTMTITYSTDGDPYEDVDVEDLI